MSKWIRVGTVMVKQSGNGNYVKVNEDVVLKKGMILQVQDPRTRPGITAEQLAKIPEFVLSELVLPPPREGDAASGFVATTPSL